MEELDLKELFDLFLSKIFLIILIVILAIGVGFVYTFFFITPKYTSTTRLVLTGVEKSSSSETNSITTTDITINSKLVSTYSELIKSTKVLRPVIESLNISIDEENLKNNISVKAKDDTELIEVSVTNEDAALASKIANEIAKVFSDLVPEIYNMNNVYILDEAEVSNEPSNINHTKDIIIFAFAGVVVAVAYVLIANMLDTTIKSPEDIEKGVGLPVLVSIPLIENFNSVKGVKKK